MKQASFLRCFPFAAVFSLATCPVAWSQSTENKGESSQNTKELTSNLKSADPLKRIEAAQGLAQKADSDAIKALCAHQKDTDEAVSQAVQSALVSLGGMGLCSSSPILFTVEIHGDAAQASQMEQKLKKEMALHPRIVCDKKNAPKSNKISGFKVKLTLSHQTEETESSTLVHCSVSQSIFDDQSLAFRGSATQRATIDLDLPKAPPEELLSGQNDCFDAVFPPIRDNLIHYLDQSKAQ